MKEAGINGKMSLLRNYVARNTLIQEQQGEINECNSKSSCSSDTLESNLSFTEQKDQIPSIEQPIFEIKRLD